MRSFIILLFCSSLVFGKPANDDLIENESKVNIPYNLMNHIDSFMVNSNEKCDYCYDHYQDFRTAFQNPEIRELFLAMAKQRCPDEKCYEKMVKFVNSVMAETDPNKGCKPLCDDSNKNEQQRLLMRGLIKEEHFFSIWDKIACSQCHKYHSFLHEAFKNSAFREYYLATGRQLCIDNDCVKKLEALVKAITKETNEKKACKPVCDY